MQKIKELYFSSKGRISRKSFVLGILGLMAIGFILLILLFFILGVSGQNLQNSPETTLLGILFIYALMIVLLVANINLHIKRFHDIDMSGWWALTIFLPYINSLVALIIAFIPGTQSKNRFGDNPIETPAKEDEEQIDDNKEDGATKNKEVENV